MRKVLPLIITILMIGMVGCAKKVYSTTLDKGIENKYAFAAASDATGEVTEPTPEPTIIPSTEPTATPEPTPTPTSTPKPVTETTTAPEPTPTATPKPEKTVYDMYQIDKNKVIKDSSKYRININNLSPKVESDVGITIECDTPMLVHAKSVQLYANKSASFDINSFSDDHKTYSDTFPTQKWDTYEGNKVKLYVFIEDYTDKNIYEYDFTLTLQK
jgi:hypothetical protein